MRVSRASGLEFTLRRALLVAIVVSGTAMAEEPAGGGGDGLDSGGGDETYDDSASSPERPDSGWGPVDSGGTGGSLSAGGLSAPDALLSEGNERSTVEEELAEAERRDSGRGLEFVWATGELGLSHVALTGLGDSDFAPGAETTATGLGWGAAVGVRLLYFVAGVHFRLSSLDAFDLWTLTADLGLKVPLGNFEPYAVLAVGYAGVSRLDVGGTTFDAGGMPLRLLLGGDYYLSDFISVGASVSGEFLFLSRDPVDGASGALGSSGSAVGTALLLSGVFGLHF